MIVTCKKTVPFRWIFFAVSPGVANVLGTCAMGTAFIYSLKKFIDNPAGLIFLLTLPTFVSILWAPFISIISDRIWTRFGRRKPFIALAWTGLVISLFMMPLAPSIWTLLGLYVAFNIFNDLAGPNDSLLQEVVPPHQRGLSTGTNTWCTNIANTAFYFLALGRFDDVRFMAGFPISGEQVIYWTAAGAFVGVLAFVTLGIRELNPHSPLVGQPWSVGAFIKSLLDRDLWPVYTLVIGCAVWNAGLGPVGNLLYTDQWAYSKQDMGTNVVIGGSLNILFVAVLTFIADRLDRMKAYQTLIVMILTIKAAFFIYVHWVLPDQRPELPEIVFFGEMMSIFSLLSGMIFTPLVFDYVVRNKLGTFIAGTGMVNRIVSLITLNGVGLFIWGYSALFQPPAGDMVRAVVNGDVPKSEIQSLLQHTAWTHSQDGSPLRVQDVHLDAWYATGLRLNHGWCWEIRLPDRQSQQLAAQAEDLRNKASGLVADEDLARDEARAASANSAPNKAAKLLRRADDEKAQVDALQTKIGTIEATLLDHAENLKRQVSSALGDHLFKEGDQILSTDAVSAIVLSLPATRRADDLEITDLRARLRKARPDLIDVRPVKNNVGWGLAASSVLRTGEQPQAIETQLESAMKDGLATLAPALVPTGAACDAKTERAVQMNLRIIEEPLDTRVSPIMKVCDAVTALFGHPHDPEHRLNAIKNSLVLAGQTEQVRVSARNNQDKMISVTALLEPSATKVASLNTPVGQRFSTLLASSGGGDLAAQAAALYDRVEKAAADQRITIAHPFVASTYAPIQYDYMCGYIWMFVLSLGGLALTVAFSRRERAGKIRKYGVEEAMGIEDDAHLVMHEDHSGRPTQYYTPGALKRKLAVLALGLAILAFGIFECWTPSWLLCTGTRTAADAVSIVKVKKGLADQVMTDDRQVTAAREESDRSFLFWNLFHFKSGEGKDMTIRCPIASELQPLYPLIDEDGLPTSLTVIYSPANPNVLIFPGLFSTWYVPGTIMFIGLFITLIGSFLAASARRPIALPHLIDPLDPNALRTSGAVDSAIVLRG